MENAITDTYNNLLCVLVIYKQSLGDSATFISLSEGLEAFLPGKLDLLVYDNSPVSQDVSVVRQPGWNITYIHDSSNAGVSKAYNEGCKLAASMNKKWLLLLDQDTVFPPGAIESYLTACVEQPGQQVFAPVLKSDTTIYSPSLFFLMQGYSPKEVTGGLNSFSRFSPLNSGLFISRQLFERAGGFNEKIKLDFSDFYFIGKVRKQVPDFWLTDIVCRHHLSAENTEVGSVVNRFKYYCSGARYSITGLVSMMFLTLITFRRAVKLSLRYKRYVFFKIFMVCFLRGGSI